MLVLVQSRLRGAFEEMLQHVANARAAIESWTQKSGHELKQVDAAADSWKTSMQQHRSQNSAKLQKAADDQINERTRIYNDLVARHDKQFLEQVAASEAESLRQKSAIENWRAWK